MFYQKHIEVGAHFLGGKGVGRYGDTVWPTLRSIRLVIEKALPAMQLLGDAWSGTRRTGTVYGYGGGEYVGKTWYWNASWHSRSAMVRRCSTIHGCGTETLPTAGNGFAPGALGSCVGQTKSIIEGTVGFWYKPYNGPKGRLQMGSQYSYLTRDAWVGYGLPPYHNRSRQIHDCSDRDREHVVYLVPLLPAVIGGSRFVNHYWVAEYTSPSHFLHSQLTTSLVGLSKLLTVGLERSCRIYKIVLGCTIPMHLLVGVSSCSFLASSRCLCFASWPPRRLLLSRLPPGTALPDYVEQFD